MYNNDRLYVKQFSRNSFPKLNRQWVIPSSQDKNKLQSKIKLKMLFDKNSDIPKCNNLVEKTHLDKPTLNNWFEKGICDKVVTNVILSEKAYLLLDKNACMMF